MMIVMQDSDSYINVNLRNFVLNRGLTYERFTTHGNISKTNN